MRKDRAVFVTPGVVLENSSIAIPQWHAHQLFLLLFVWTGWRSDGEKWKRWEAKHVALGRRNQSDCIIQSGSHMCVCVVVQMTVTCWECCCASVSWWGLSAPMCLTACVASNPAQLHKDPAVSCWEGLELWCTNTHTLTNIRHGEINGNQKRKLLSGCALMHMYRTWINMCAHIGLTGVRGVFLFSLCFMISTTCLHFAGPLAYDRSKVTSALVPV